MSAPARTAGVTVGTVTVRKTRSRPAPRFVAASSRERSMELMAAETIRKTYGKNCRVKTSTMPFQP